LYEIGDVLSLKYDETKIFPLQTNTSTNRKLWSSGRALDSQSEGRGFDPRPMLNGSGVKPMPGTISAPNSGSL